MDRVDVEVRWAIGANDALRVLERVAGWREIISTVDFTLQYRAGAVAGHRGG